MRFTTRFLDMASKKRIILLAFLAVLIVVALAYGYRDGHWFGAEPEQPNALTLSGNIEAHESVLSFKTVQARLVQLPFNEGQWVTKGATVAVVDDADYSQQVSIAEAGQTVQQRQAETARQNLEAARKTILVDEAQLAQRKLDYRRSVDLSTKGFVSAATLDQAKTALQVAEASLDRDRALRSVAERNVEVAQAGLQNSAEAVKLARIVEMLRSAFTAWSKRGSFAAAAGSAGASSDAGTATAITPAMPARKSGFESLAIMFMPRCLDTKP